MPQSVISSWQIWQLHALSWASGWLQDGMNVKNRLHTKIGHSWMESLCNLQDDLFVRLTIVLVSAHLPTL